MGRHADDQRPRGIARWVIVGVVVVLLLVAVSVGYLIIVRDSDTADPACQGQSAVAVAAGPSVSPAVRSAVAAYNATSPVVRSLCVTASVTTVTDSAALAGLTGSWPSAGGPAPSLWIPDDEAYLSALDASRPDLAAGHPTDPVAWSPVVVAVRPGDAEAVRSVSWAALPESVGPSGTLALPDDRRLLLALPDARTNPATGLAAQSVVAGTVGTTKAVTAADVTQAAPALDALGTGSASGAGTTAEALEALAGNTGNATAVPVAEADLVAFDATNGGDLAAVHPGGPTAANRIIPARMSGSWVDQDLATAATAVASFLADPGAQQIFADAGWRTASARPAHPIPGVDTTAPVTALPTASPAVGAAIAAAIGHTGVPTTSQSPPATTTGTTGTTGTTPTTSGAPTTPAATTRTGTTGTSGTTITTTKQRPPSTTKTSPNPAASGPVLTILVDRSSDLSRTVGGKPLTDWVQDALTSVTNGRITDTAGLWTSSSLDTPGGYAQVVTTGPVSGTVGTTTRSDALASAISGLEAGGSRWIYGAIIAADASAVSGAAANRDDRLVVITTGADATPHTPRLTVINAVKSGAGKVRVDIIGLGPAVPATAFDQIATAGGGIYQPVTDPADLTQAMTDLLTSEPPG